MTDSDSQTEGYLTGQLLIAMPQMLDPRFTRTVIYMCGHSKGGAMGLVVNKLLENITFSELLDQLGLEKIASDRQIPIHFGGPVDSGRGFVLHTADYVQDATMVIDGNIALTSTTDILQDIAEGNGPRSSILALGYAGWGPEQLDGEIQANGWLSVDADDTLMFDVEPGAAWEAALAKIGVSASMLSGDAGRA